MLIKGFKDSVAIREGIFGKGGGKAKDGGGGAQESATSSRKNKEKTDHGLIKKVKDKKEDKDKVRNSQKKFPVKVHSRRQKHGTTSRAHHFECAGRRARTTQKLLCIVRR